LNNLIKAQLQFQMKPQQQQQPPPAKVRNIYHGKFGGASFVG
jgi:hypothetical protein